MSVAAFEDEVLISAHDISKQYDGFRLEFRLRFTKVKL